MGVVRVEKSAPKFAQSLDIARTIGGGGGTTLE